jgi:hypothetical protein
MHSLSTGKLALQKENSSAVQSGKTPPFRPITDRTLTPKISLLLRSYKPDLKGRVAAVLMSFASPSWSWPIKPWWGVAALLPCFGLELQLQLNMNMERNVEATNSGTDWSV